MLLRRNHYEKWGTDFSFPVVTTNTMSILGEKFPTAPKINLVVCEGITHRKLLEISSMFRISINFFFTLYQKTIRLRLSSSFQTKFLAFGSAF